MKELNTDDAQHESLKNQITELRDSLYAEEDALYAMVMYMVKLWSDIKRERLLQKFSSTTIVFKVTGTAVDKDDDEKRYRDRVRFEVYKRRKQDTPADDEATRTAVTEELQDKIRQPGCPELTPIIFIEGIVVSTVVMTTRLHG